MNGFSTKDTDADPSIEQAVNSHIRPWKWGLAAGCYVPLSQLLSIIGSPNPEFESYVWIIFLMQGLTGAFLGFFAAFAARNVVKAIRC